MWVYQTMDAVDGKQARRTKSSSPLGQLFDHGCDAFGTTPLALAIISALGIGATPKAVAILATVQIPFFMAQFEEHFAHTMRTQVGYFGVTEGQYLEMILLLCTAAVGPQVWDTELVDDFTLRDAFVWSGCVFPILLALASAWTVLRYPSAPWWAFIKLAPLYASFACLFWVSLQHAGPLHHVFAAQPAVVLGVFGCYFAHLVNRVIIASVCKVPFAAFEPSIMLPIPVVLACSALQPRYVPQLVAVHAALVVGQFAHHAVCVCVQIASHLRIHVFTLGKRE